MRPSFFGTPSSWVSNRNNKGNSPESACLMVPPFPWFQRETKRTPTQFILAGSTQTKDTTKWSPGRTVGAQPNLAELIRDRPYLFASSLLLVICRFLSLSSCLSRPIARLTSRQHLGDQKNRHATAWYFQSRGLSPIIYGSSSLRIFGMSVRSFYWGALSIRSPWRPSATRQLL